MPYRSTDAVDEGISWSATILSRVLQEPDYDNATDYSNETYGDYEEETDYGYDADYAKKEKGPVPLDYSVLSIGILTLGLVLFVEISRHWIDHKAHGKPFFKAVLVMLYSELATLGIVEFAVFVLIKYYDDLDKEKKEVFGDVHFALFYTAVFNAFQSSLTALLTRQASHRLWVRTEQLELDHYVEIREEYERVSMEVHAHEAQTRLGKWLRNCLLFVRRPGLRGKYHNLRVQVRFHELRLQFLEAHNLPLSLKVSEYLKRSEMGVLIGLVHISGTAWLLLTGGLATLYYLLGIVGYKTADVDVLGMCMTGVFLGLLFAFIIVSLALQYKMERIFLTIMKTPIDKSSDHEEGLQAQKSLFWFGSPSLVVSLIQFMNFGYAIALAVVIMYWPYLTLVEPYWYLITVFGCYFIFLYNLSVLLPQFTLCTSLGFLTNHKQLQETVARHRLEEAQRLQRRKMIERAIENDSVIILATNEDALDSLTSLNSGEGSGGGTQKTVASVMRSSAGGIIPVEENPKEKLLADLVKSDTTSLRKQLPEESRENLLVRDQSRRTTRKKAVSDGVAAMRGLSGGPSVPFANSQSKLDSAVIPRLSRKQRVESRRSARKKSISQPDIIKGWQDSAAAAKAAEQAGHSVDDAEAEYRKHKSNSESGVIKAWQDSQVVGLADITSEHFKAADGEGPIFVKKKQIDDSVPKWKQERVARLVGRRQARKKTQSESAVIHSWRDFAVTDDQPGSAGTSSGSQKAPQTNINEIECTVINAQDVSAPNQATFTAENSVVESSMQSTSKDMVDLADALIVKDGKPFPSPPSQPSKAGIHTDTEGDWNGDDQSIQTDKSIGNLSDVDVFETTRRIAPRSLVETVDPFLDRVLQHCSPSALTRDTKLYFLGLSYPTISHVFGTLIVFFIIGHRVEAFIALSGFIIGADDFGWATNLLNMYWSIVVWLICFIIADLMVLILFPLRRCTDLRERTISLAAMLDLILTSTVIILMFVAEAQRCCTEDWSRSLSKPMYEFEEDCTCGRWGSRTYSGLGYIEPFGSLIALRIFRFVLAAFLLKEMDKDKSKSAEDYSQDTEKEQISDPNSHSDDQGGHSHDDHGHEHGHEDGGETALELWERAISQHPDIVEKYGQFSGELLQAMLGLHVDVQASQDMSALSVSRDGHDELQNGTEHVEDSQKPETWQSHIKLTGDKYSNLAPDAQGFIIAGRLGKPVRSMEVPMDQNLSGGLLPTVDEGAAGLSQTNTPGFVEFEVDTDQMAVERGFEFSFVAPFARLVRSMRRCDRRHLPLLTKWVSVDVVMTQFEIVYFEANDETSESMNATSKLRDRALQSALRATKGGKGLRLCDVAKGRKVVGHLDFADVTQVHVEQDEEAVSDVSLLEKAAKRFHYKNDLSVELWHNASQFPSETDPKRFARAIRWTFMTEERLKLTTVSGTLVLRFYSDLERAEIEKLGNTSHILKKDIALQWAETVARICGPDQLQQELPHFGEGNDAELQDYLENVHFHNREAEKERKRAERGAGDLKYLYGEAEDPSSKRGHRSSLKVKKSVLLRPKSFGEPEGGSERSFRRPNPMKSFRRSVSMGASGSRNGDDDADGKIEAPSKSATVENDRNSGIV